MKIIVTGGTGLVGSAIKKISNRYPKYSFIFISSKDCDLTDFQETTQMFNKLKPDYVIHLAANVGGLFKNMNQKVKMFEDNLMINYNVVKCCYAFRVKKLVAILSTCIFPDKVSYPITEEMLHQGPPHDSNEGYAYAKRMLEIHIKKYREEYNMDFVCVSPCNVYGPNDNFNLEDSHVIPALIHKCFLAKKENTNFTIRGDGSPLRQFIYSEDLGELILKILEKNNISDSNIILSPEKEYSIKELAENIKEAFNYRKEITFNTEFSNGQYRKNVSNQKLLELFPDFKFTSLEYGIRETISWFINNYETCRK